MGSINRIPQQPQQFKDPASTGTGRDASNKNQYRDESAFLALIKEHQGIQVRAGDDHIFSLKKFRPFHFHMAFP